MMRKVVQWALGLARITSEFEELPASVEVCRRAGNDHDVFILINHGSVPETIPLPAAMKEVIGPAIGTAGIVLEPQGIAVLESAGR
jgi:hypothetical protein